MAKQSALDTLLELAQTRTDDAAKRLGALNAQGVDMEAKLALLVQYWQEYSARFQVSMQQGITASDWRNYQEFLDKLDAAVVQQRELLAATQQRVEAGRVAWQSAKRTLKSYRHAGTASDESGITAPGKARTKGNRRACE